MLFSWLDAREEVEAASTLADSFRSQAAPEEAIREFLPQAVDTVHSRNLNFYKRARFANALRWRLQENGVRAEIAAEVTQALLVVAAAQPASTAALPPPRRARRSADSLARKAREASTRGDYSEAVKLYTALVALRPRDAEALNDLGATLTRLGRYEQAEATLRRAIARRPDYPLAYVNLAALLISQGLFAEAENGLRQALSAEPADVAARNNLGLVLALQGRLDAAREELGKVLRVAPRQAEALYGLGTVFMIEGRFQEAEEQLKRALQAHPQFSPAWSALVWVRRMTPADKPWLKRAEQTADSLCAPTEEADVRFAIGKYFDDVGDYAKAFKSYRRANQLLKSIARPYERAAHTSFVDDMIRVYSQQSISPPAAGSASTKPILVTGMMRSGTSLVEQILASHPKASGAGELDFWKGVVRKHEALVRHSLLADTLRQELADRYLRTLAYRAPDSDHVVDKAPVNSDYLGLIHSVFPNARILYLRRHPIDTCLSCYFQPFSTALNFSLDLSDLAHYYTEHARLVAHWRKVLPPGTLLEVPYEELVADQERWTRKILDFLGLDWDERCLRFHQTPRAVLTASRWQVRQPMYRDSVQRWRNYAKFIGPLRDLKGV